VDDDPLLRRSLAFNLERAGYRASTAVSAEDALALARRDRPELILLDIALPGMDGLEALRRFRELGEVPIIFLTGLRRELDEILGLELGADDYVTKPFSPRELSSRIKALLRRAEMPAPTEKTMLEIDDRLSVDFQRHEVWVDGERVKLRPTEYRLLYHLVNNAGWVMSHEVLLAKVWGPEYRDEIQYLRLYVNYLRQKIEPDPAHPQYILTERGVGYRFVDLEERTPGDTEAGSRTRPSTAFSIADQGVEALPLDRNRTRDRSFWHGG
jgi:DNA-binding response OmpR family regulator